MDPYDHELRQRLLDAAREYLEHTGSAGFVLPLEGSEGLYVAVGRLKAIKGLVEGEIDYQSKA